MDRWIPLILVLPLPLQSFEIRYTLRADDMDPEEGVIHVVVKEYSGAAAKP